MGYWIVGLWEDGVCRELSGAGDIGLSVTAPLL